ncbi:MAG: alpha-L-fucosidase, partial [Candidatus Helarchaeota archaeon]
YGKDFSYDDFIPLFNKEIQNWDPNAWAELFQKAGARYVVLVTKHHDGFLLWPSKYQNPHKKGYVASRDIVGELTKAVKEKGLRMGFYYSGALDWSFTETPIQDFITFVKNGPLDPEYAEYVDKHWYELIDRYDPAILWNDIGYPPLGKEKEVIAYFYNKTPEGVINDRWMKLTKNLRRLLNFWPIKVLVSWLAKRALVKGTVSSTLKPPHCDFRTPEYAHFKKIMKSKWESTRGIGHSFGYNKMEPLSNYLNLQKLVHMFIDIVSKNGNLLLNIGPMADGTIPEIQKKLLLDFGKWLQINGVGLFETRPWIRAEGQPLDALEVRYTQKEDTLYAFILGKPEPPQLGIKSLIVEDNTEIVLLGNSNPLNWKQDGINLIISIPENLYSAPAYGFQIIPLPKQINK